MGYQYTDECEQYIAPGDVNADGLINVLDVVLTVNLAVSGEYNENADMNSDGTVNVLDIVQMINIITA